MYLKKLGAACLKFIFMLINIRIRELQNCINNINLLIVLTALLPPKPHVFVTTNKECGFFRCRWFGNIIKKVKEFFFSAWLSRRLLERCVVAARANKEFFSLKNYFIVNKSFFYQYIDNYIFNITFFFFMILTFLYQIYSSNVFYYIYLVIFISYYYSYNDFSKKVILDKV